MTTALFWHREADGTIRCDLCPHGCRLADGMAGLCRVRTAVGEELKAESYGRISSAGLDPMEKKPLYHFCPGRQVFSIGGWGCNFGCSFCQNWTISQQFLQDEPERSPGDVVRLASGSVGMAYTYNEPIIGYEFVRDCAVLARREGFANVLVTNGYIRPSPAAELIPLMDAMNIDIKSMDEDFYRRQCRGTLQPVLDFAVQAVQGGCHVEITNLLIPGLNDTQDHVGRLARWMKDHLGPAVPLHLSAYRPMYKMKVEATSADIVRRARDVARRELLYVYVGNLPDSEGCDTACPGCGKLLIERRGYRTALRGIRDGQCAGCGRMTEIVMEPRRHEASP